MPTSTVPLHQLGKNGPRIPALGFGLMGLSIPSYGKTEGDEERLKVLDRAFELGATFWDSAEYASSTLPSKKGVDDTILAACMPIMKHSLANGSVELESATRSFWERSSG